MFSHPEWLFVLYRVLPVKSRLSILFSLIELYVLCVKVTIRRVFIFLVLSIFFIALRFYICVNDLFKLMFAKGTKFMPSSRFLFFFFWYMSVCLWGVCVYVWDVGMHLLYAHVCVQTWQLHMHREVGGGYGYTALSVTALLPQGSGVSQNLELGWQLVSHRPSPVFTFPKTGVTDLHVVTFNS